MKFIRSWFDELNKLQLNKLLLIEFTHLKGAVILFCTFLYILISHKCINIRILIVIFN